MDIEIKTTIDQLNDIERKVYHHYLNKKIDVDTYAMMIKLIDSLKIGLQLYKIT